MQSKAKRRLRILILSAILSAMGVILGQYLSIKIGDSLRIGFGSLPVLLAGALFGPWVGLLVGAVSDIVGCILYYGLGNMIPLVTLGMMAEGFLAGLIARVTGSLILRSLGLYLRYKTPLETLILRVPCVAIESVLMSAFLVYILCYSTALKKALKGWAKRDDDLR